MVSTNTKVWLFSLPRIPPVFARGPKFQTSETDGEKGPYRMMNVESVNEKVKFVDSLWRGT